MTLSDEEKKRIIEEEKFRAAAKKKANKSGFGCGTIIVVCVVVYFVIRSLGIQHAPPEPPKISAPTASIAGLMAKDFVTAALKSPSTATFPSSLSIKSVDLGDGIYQVNSYVDSQNGFGAMIRSNWTVKLKHLGGDAYSIKNWMPLDIQLK